MNPSYAILMWMIAGGLAGWLASRRRECETQRGHAGCVVAGIIGAISGGSLVELALRDDPSKLGSIACLLVAVLGALVGQALAPGMRRHVT
jgi:uncharacterized membrane protein YeaQ/YmgE (transglycosylase-associated protein family)